MNIARNRRPPAPRQDLFQRSENCVYRRDYVFPNYDWTPYNAREYIEEVSLLTEFEDLSGPLTFESIRYVIPEKATPKGLVVLFDGGSGSQLWFETTEGRLITEVLVLAQYAVLAIDLAKGNDNTWKSINLYEPHVAELTAAVSRVRNVTGPRHLPPFSGTTRWPFPPSAATRRLYLPLFYVGFSKGGGFASKAHRDLPATAQVLFNTSGHEEALDTTHQDYSVPPPPTLWVLGINDNPLVPVTNENPPVKVTMRPNAEGEYVPYAFRRSLAETYHDDLKINHDLAVDVLQNDMAHPSKIAFARIRTSGGVAVSNADSEDIFDAMTSWDPVLIENTDRCPVVTRRGDLDLMKDFPWPASARSTAVKLEVKYQNDELGGYHQITSDFTGEILDFFQTAVSQS